MREKRYYFYKFIKVSIVIILFLASNIINAGIHCIEWHNGNVTCGYVDSCPIGGNGMDMGGNRHVCVGTFGNYSEAMKSPRLLVDSENNAVLDFDGKIINILSDHLYEFITSEKYLDTDKPINNDDREVSQERLEEIANNFNIKIIKVVKLPEANYCPLCEDEKETSLQKSIFNTKTIAIIALALIVLFVLIVFRIKKTKGKKK